MGKLQIFLGYSKFDLFSMHRICLPENNTQIIPLFTYFNFSVHLTNSYLKLRLWITAFLNFYKDSNLYLNILVWLWQLCLNCISFNGPAIFTLGYLGIFFSLGICCKYTYFLNKFQSQYAYRFYAYKKDGF